MLFWWPLPGIWRECVHIFPSQRKMCSQYCSLSQTTTYSNKKEPIDVPNGFFWFSVDSFNSKRNRHHFLTHHAHTQRPLHSYGISSGLSLFSTFFHFSRDTYLFLFIYLFLWVLCSLTLHYLWELKLFNPQVCLCFPLSLSRFLMSISALVV